MSDRASTVVPLPLSVVESNIWDVTSWPAFLGGLEWVERTAHERYLFGVREGRRIVEVPVVVRWFARNHRVTWRELEGPPWRGEIRLTAMNGRRTRVTMEVSLQPHTFLRGVVQRLGRRGHDVDPDLSGLRDRLAAIPQPLNPARLGEPRRRTRQQVRAPANCGR